MFRFSKIILYVLLFSLLILFANACANTQSQLALAMEDYSNMLQEGIPENVSLTIYLSSLHVLYRKAQTVDDLIRSADIQIVVGADEMEEQQEFLEKLDAGNLQATDDARHIDARVYYVFENADGEKILDIAISPTSLGKIEGTVHINGISVYWDPIFYDLIEPFLTDDAHDLLGF